MRCGRKAKTFDGSDRSVIVCARRGGRCGHREAAIQVEADSSRERRQRAVAAQDGQRAKTVLRGPLARASSRRSGTAFDLVRAVPIVAKEGGPDLPRTRIGSEAMVGEVVCWKGHFGGGSSPRARSIAPRRPTTKGTS